MAARGMWGAKRKRDEDDASTESVSTGLNGGFEARQQAAASFGINSVGNTIGTTTQGGDSGLGGTVATLLNAYVQMMQELVDSPDFENLVTPDQMRGILSQLPGFTDSPEVKAMLDSPQFQDPALLRETIMQGLLTIKTYSSEIVDMFSDPMKLTQMLEQLPQEMRTAIEGMVQGDMSGLKQMLSMVPGISEAQQGVLMDLLDGNMSGLAASAKDMLSAISPDQTEAARQQFLANPSLAEMAGISSEVLNDKKQFSELMAQGVDALMAAASGGSDSSESESGIDTERLLKGAAMSA